MEAVALSGLLAGVVGEMVVVFSRVGTVFILMPGFGDCRIPARIRLTIAILISLSLYPLVGVPQVGGPTSILLLTIIQEVVVGAFLATAIRFFFLALHILGSKVGFISGLSNALSPNDGNFESATSLSGLLFMAAATLMFATDMHHLVLSGVVRSYDAIPVGRFPVEDMVSQLVRISSDMFLIALYIGAPFMIFSVLFNLGLGLANRVMPTMQVFFVASPAMIIIGLLILAASSSAIITTVNSQLSDWLYHLVR